MEHEKALLNRDRASVSTATPLVTRAMLGGYPRAEILVLLPPVERIERDALLDLPALEAVVVDARSKCRPEECDYGREGGVYRHVHVFRVNTKHPQSVAFPDTTFKEGYPVPVLLHSGAAGMVVCVSDGRILTSTREGYEVQTLRFPRGEYAVGDSDIKVAEWDGKDYGVPEGGALRVPYGVEAIREKQYSENKKLRSVHIPPTVKIIGDAAFQRCSNLTAVTLAGVREIETCAFQYTCLREVTITGSVDRIGGYSFNSCASLTSVEIREGVQLIGDYAFSLSALASIHIPSSMIRMGINPFPRVLCLTSSSPRFKVENDALVDVEEGRLVVCVTREKEHVIPEGIRVIGKWAFADCKELECASISGTVKEIGEYAFDSTGLTHVMIPGNVRMIGNFAFNKCRSLETVVLCEGLESIGDSAFEFTPLRSLTIPSTVASISINPFNVCKYLALRSTSTQFVVTDKGELVNVKEGRLITYFYNNRAEEYVVSDCVRTIGLWAVANNHQVKTVTLHEAIEDVAESAFRGCTELVAFVIPEGVRRMSGKWIFRKSDNLTSLTVPHSLWTNKGIGPETLVGSSITRVCFVIHSEEEKRRLKDKTIGGKEMETITFKLERQ